jgi:hypothetical protein
MVSAEKPRPGRKAHLPCSLAQRRGASASAKLPLPDPARPGQFIVFAGQPALALTSSSATPGPQLVRQPRVAKACCPGIDVRSA